MSRFPNLCHNCGMPLPLEERHPRCPSCRTRIVPVEDEVRGTTRMYRQAAFIVLVFVTALAATVALYWLVTELYPLLDFLACYTKLLLGGVCIAPAPDILS